MKLCFLNVFRCKITIKYFYGLNLGPKFNIILGSMDLDRTVKNLPALTTELERTQSHGFRR